MATFKNAFVWTLFVLATLHTGLLWYADYHMKTIVRDSIHQQVVESTNRAILSHNSRNPIEEGNQH